VGIIIFKKREGLVLSIRKNYVKILKPASFKTNVSLLIAYLKLITTLAFINDDSAHTLLLLKIVYIRNTAFIFIQMMKILIH